MPMSHVPMSNNGLWFYYEIKQKWRIIKWNILCSYADLNKCTAWIMDRPEQQQLSVHLPSWYMLWLILPLRISTASPFEREISSEQECGGNASGLSALTLPDSDYNPRSSICLWGNYDFIIQRLALRQSDVEVIAITVMYLRGYDAGTIDCCSQLLLFLQ